MVVKILGTGCKKCKQLYNNSLKAVELLGKEIQVEKVEDIKDIMSYGAMSTPALVVDEKIVAAGQVLSVEEIKNLIGSEKTSCCCGGNEKTSCCEEKEESSCCETEDNNHGGCCCK